MKYSKNIAVDDQAKVYPMVSYLGRSSLSVRSLRQRICVSCYTSTSIWRKKSMFPDFKHSVSFCRQISHYLCYWTNWTTNWHLLMYLKYYSTYCTYAQYPLLPNQMSSSIFVFFVIYRAKTISHSLRNLCRRVFWRKHDGPQHPWGDPGHHHQLRVQLPAQDHRLPDSALRGTITHDPPPHRSSTGRSNDCSASHFHKVFSI